LGEGRLLKLGKSLAVGDFTIWSEGKKEPVAHATVLDPASGLSARLITKFRGGVAQKLGRIGQNPCFIDIGGFPGRWEVSPKAETS